MRYILLCCSLFVFFNSQAQQINPVPDYVFQNRMSVGRTAVTDTAAYFSIGPRYGATRGFMPPMVIDTASVTGTKRNGLLIFSIQKNKFLYWDSVRVQWSDMAGSSGSYITGTLTNRYIPKATGTTTLGNSLMYDSSSHVRAYGNWIGNNNSSRFLFQTEVDGQNGYGLKVQQNDSNDNNIQYVTTFRHGLVTSAKPRPEFGVGHDMSVPDDAGTFRRVGTILTRLTDTTAAGISAKMQFGVAKSGSIVTPLQIYSDSSVRMAKLAGSGSRYVVADANGDLTATSANAIVDTLSISTRLWRQKGIDSVATLANTKIGGSGTTNYIPKFTGSTTLGNSIISDNGATAYVAGSLELNNTSELRWKTNAGTGQNVLMMFSDDNVYLSAPVASSNLIFRGTGFSERMRLNSGGELLIATTTDAGDYKLQVAGSIYNTTGAVFAASSGNVGIGTSTFGTSAATVMAIANGTAPSSSPADAFQMYSKDITGGNAAPHFRTENGAIIKLYQETTSVGSATFVANTGTSVQTGSTFDGYTLQQVVQALRNQGILQ